MRATTSPSLPQPDENSSAHSERCARYIRKCIQAAGGSISFAEYMQHALYAPGLGYYTAGATKFGAAGDFVTAPEVSPIFSRVVARQCAEVLRQTKTGSILEFGAGSGRLAVDALKKLAAINCLPDEYLILEVSADLQDRQRQCFLNEIPELIGRIRWINRLPAEFSGVMIANEVLDAIPVERFVRRDKVYAQRVVCEQNDFALRECVASDNLLAAVEALEQELGQRLPDGYVSEISLAAVAWIEEILRPLQKGVALLFDYGLGQGGYYARDRSDGWLRCHFRHHAHNNPLIMPGIQDITAWVNFSAVASAAVNTGARVAGYTDQAHFLMGGGLEEELASMTLMRLDAQTELSAQVKMLTLPGNMGEHFKCMALARVTSVAPSAFQLADRTHTL